MLRTTRLMRSRLHLCGALVILALLSACTAMNAVPEEPTVASSAHPMPPPSPTLPPPPTMRPTATPAPTLAPSSTVAPTATASATPRPQVVLAIPPEWQRPAETAIARSGDAEPPWRLDVAAVADPAAALNAGGSQIALLPDDGGIPIASQPLAVAVPFGTEWHTVTAAQAEGIRVDGHRLARVIPWGDLTSDLRALRVDGFYPLDPGYSLQQPWSLHAAPGYEEAASFLAGQLELGRADMAHLAAVGDLMLDRALGVVIANGRLDYPFAEVAAVLQQADIAVGNLESALGDSGEPVAKAYTFRAPPGAAEAVARAGFDVVSLANNHALDYGPEALSQGMNLLQRQDVRTVGAGANASRARAPAFIEAGGMLFAFLGYVDVPQEGVPPYFDNTTWTATESAPGVAWAIPEEIAADVAAAAEQANHVVVLLHSGYEYVASPSPPQRAAARAAIDAGAALVIGHHAHILQGVEFYNGGVIVYGLGNFAFPIDGPPETAILHAWFGDEGVHQLDLQPAVVQPGGQPRLATPEEATAIRSQIYYLTRALNP
ncbi:MAG: CapA family protein [Candidatus Promineifilaceae bacterium]|nr:CapA family protein [Candidatus Promineifilaceae bacterium]